MKELLKKTIFRMTLAGFVLAVFGGFMTLATWVFIKGIVQGEVVTVPQLTGLKSEQAQRVVEQLSLVYQIDGGPPVHTDVIEKDRVFLQIPKAGSRIKTGRTVEVTISAGPERKVIPKLRGKTLSFSRTLLKQSEVEPNIISRTNSELENKGRVLSQTPHGGEEIGLKAGVSLLVSEGPQDPWFITPDFVGKEYQTVKSFLDRHGIRVVTKYKEGDDDLGQIVLRQIPKSGYPFSQSQTLTLIVNKDF